mmetsp:Transcript_625/g.634  ORF Transcript_625/g.634 Transcript_625/m.634 type:complete len:100 (-) Transcript_625:66-365(-)
MSFFNNMEKIAKSDLGIVIGSSMVVSPFNGLPEMYSKDANIATINMEPIKHIKNLNGNNSVFLEGKCDEIILQLLKDLEWEEEYNEFVSKQKESVESSQ